MNQGKIVQVIGPVVDVEFEPGKLPPSTTPSRCRARAAPTSSRTPRSSCSRSRSISARARCARWPWPRPMGSRAGCRSTTPACRSRSRSATDARAHHQHHGEPVDKMGPIKSTKTYPIHRPAPAFDQQSTKVEMFETGIKVVDLLEPYTRGGKTGLFGGAGVGKTVLIRTDQQHRQAARRDLGVRRGGGAYPRGQRPLPRDEGVGRHREDRADLRPDDRAAGSRLRVALTGVTAAEYFRDEEGQDVLLFIDNIFRFTQAGSEVSALLGRMPSAVATSRRSAPRWARSRADHVHQERLDHVGAGDLRARRRHHRPRARDRVRASGRHHRALAPAHRARHLSRGGPARLHLAHPRPDHPGAEHYGRRGPSSRPAALQGPPGHHRDPRHGGALRRGQADRGARPQAAALPLAALETWPRCSPASPAATSSSPTRSRASRRSSRVSTTSCRSRPSTWSAHRGGTGEGGQDARGQVVLLELATPTRQLVSEQVDEVVAPAPRATSGAARPRGLPGHAGQRRGRLPERPRGTAHRGARRLRRGDTRAGDHSGRARRASRRDRPRAGRSRAPARRAADGRPAPWRQIDEIDFDEALAAYQRALTRLLVASIGGG